MRGHPAVPRRSSCAAKALTVDLGCTNIGVSIATPLCSVTEYTVHAGSTHRAPETGTAGGRTQLRFAVTG